MSFYSDMADTATGMLSEFGKTVTITSTVGAYNTATSTVSNTTSTQTGYGVVFDWSFDSQRYGSTSFDQSLIQIGDRQLLLSANGVTKPSIGNTVTTSSGTYSITMVKEINPAGTPVMYECNIRGA